MAVYCHTARGARQQAQVEAIHLDKLPGLLRNLVGPVDRVPKRVASPPPIGYCGRPSIKRTLH